MPYRLAFTVAFLLLVAPRLAHGAPQLPYSVERCPSLAWTWIGAPAPRGPAHPSKRERLCDDLCRRRLKLPLSIESLVTRPRQVSAWFATRA